VDFGWRIPFFSGILMAVVALSLRCHGEELNTNANVFDHQDSEIKKPIRASWTFSFAMRCYRRDWMM
jgi:hypothetical protein